MRLIQSVVELQQLRRTLQANTVSHRDPDRASGADQQRPLTIGLVPTMGALHEGHQSLIQRCRQDNDLTVVSIFVNPLQFAPHEDLSRYPRTLEQDCQLCEQLGVDWVFAPNPTEMHPSQGSRDPMRVIPPPELIRPLCGSFRPGHFEGVLTVVAQLFHLVQPDRAYFGRKDYQQLVLIGQMVKDLWIDTTVVACPTIRDADGLALSSRNRYLSPEDRQQALGIPRALQAAQTHLKQGDPSAEGILAVARQVLASHPAVQIQYLELVDMETLQPVQSVSTQAVLAVAAHVGQTRLIDNLMLDTALDLQLTDTSTAAESPQEQQPSPRRKPLIAIDGPAGAGKSTVARRVAAQLGLLYLDTGAMYRALTWLAMEKGIPLDNQAQLTELSQQAQIRLNTQAGQQSTVGTQVWVDGIEVTTQIRSTQVTQAVSRVSAWPGVRRAMVELQRQIGQAGGVVLEGRDIGTAVFPNAELKIFLTASPRQRAQRRQRELQSQGVDVDLGSLQEQIQSRDQQDSQRTVAPLKKADDAVVIDSDALTIEQVQAEIVTLYQNL